jgi:hypothetical protein
MDSLESVQSHRSMYLVHGTTKLVAEDSNALGVVASCLVGEKTSSIEKLC